MTQDIKPNYWAEYTNLQHVKHALKTPSRVSQGLVSKAWLLEWAHRVPR